MVRRNHWIIGALAAALWIAPAAAQTGSTSRGNERAYGTGNGTDPTRSNTDPDQAPTTARGHESARDSAAGTTGTSTTGSSTTGSTDTGASASTARGEASGDVSRTLARLHEGNQQEISAGKWMEQHAQNGKVKDFAKKMVKDHGSLDKDLLSFAQKKGVDLTSAAPSSGAQSLDELKSMSGAQADRAYMDLMVQDHQRDVSEVRAAEQQAKSNQQKDLASLLDKSAKKMESHLKDARDVQRDLSQRQARNPNK